MEEQEKRQRIAEVLDDIVKTKLRDDWHMVKILIGNNGEAPVGVARYNKISIQYSAINKDSSTTGNIILL